MQIRMFVDESLRHGGSHNVYIIVVEDYMQWPVGSGLGRGLLRIICRLALGRRHKLVDSEIDDHLR